MGQVQGFLGKYGLVIGLALLALSIVMSFATKIDATTSVQLATSQNIALAGLALVIAGRR